MSCEIHRTHQRNNNNNGTTTTMVQQPHNGHRLSFCWKWATATSFAIGGTFLYSHILQHSAEGRDARIEVRERGRAGGGRVCLHFFKNTLCALMATVLRGSLLNRVFYALFYLCKIMFQLNETRAVIARNNIRAATAILCYYCCPVHATPHLPLHPLHAKGLVAHSCDAL